MTESAPLPVRYVDSAEALDELVERCGRAKRVSIDTEADSLHHYFEKVCLIQISLVESSVPAEEVSMENGQDHYIVDPLAGLDLKPLLDTIALKPLIFHGGDYDLRMLRIFHEFEPKNDVFDTMLAAQLLGFEKLGLAALVKQFYEVELPKHGQKYDWSRRPLPANLIEYATNDTRYLAPLTVKLEAELDRLGRRAWHAEACARMIEVSRQSTPRDPDQEWRIKGVSKLNGIVPAILKELWYWRDEQARKANRPSFMILGNQTLIALAEWAGEHPDENVASEGPKLPRNCKGSRLRDLQKALEKGLATPKAQWPSNRKPKDKSSKLRKARPDDALVKVIQEERDIVAKELELPPSVLAPRAVLLAIAGCRPTSTDQMVEECRMQPWQARLLGDRFLKSLHKP